MSRGLGNLQRSLLTEIGRGHASAQDLAERVFGHWPPSDSEYSACRRALRALCRRGLVVELPIRYRHEWIDARPSAQKHYALPTEASRELARMRAFYRQCAEDSA